MPRLAPLLIHSPVSEALSLPLHPRLRLRIPSLGSEPPLQQYLLVLEGPLALAPPRSVPRLQPPLPLEPPPHLEPLHPLLSEPPLLKAPLLSEGLDPLHSVPLHLRPAASEQVPSVRPRLRLALLELLVALPRLRLLRPLALLLPAPLHSALPLLLALPPPALVAGPLRPHPMVRPQLGSAAPRRRHRSVPLSKALAHLPAGLVATLAPLQVFPNGTEELALAFLPPVICRPPRFSLI